MLVSRSHFVHITRNQSAATRLIPLWRIMEILNVLCYQDMELTNILAHILPVAAYVAVM